MRLAYRAVAGVVSGASLVVLVAMLGPARAPQADDGEKRSKDTADAPADRAIEPVLDGIVDLGLPEQLDAQWRLALALIAGRDGPPGVSNPTAAKAPTDLDRFGDLGPEPVRKLSPQLIKKCLEVAQELDPQLARRLEAVLEKDPETFERIVGRLGRKLVGLAQLKASNPKLYALKVEELKAEREVTRLARKLREVRRNPSQSPSQAALTADLEEELLKQVRMQVALTIKARGQYLLRMRDHVEALQAELEEQALNFLETVEKRMQELMQPPTQSAHLDRRARDRSSESPE